MNFKSAKKFGWKEKLSPKAKNVGSGWCNELNLAFADKNLNYAVMTRKINTEWGEIEHACIKNKNNTDIPWAEKQRIKNELFGEDLAAIEVFPKTKDLVDEANMYHLWILPKNFVIPFGLK